MLDRLTTAHSTERMFAAITAVLDSNQRFKYASQLEGALLVELGAGNIHTAPNADTSRVLTARDRQDRRVRGLACTWCHDSGWVIDHELVVHRCECSGGTTTELVAQPELTHPRQWIDPESHANAIAQARLALTPPTTEGEP